MKHILLVEDNADDVELTLRAFRFSLAGCDVRVARDGEAALSCLIPDRDAAPLPSLVLLDLKLPGMDGLGVLERIREHERTRVVPVVVLTSSAEPADLSRAYELGANSYVRKPVSFRDFVSATNLIAGYWLSLNEVPPV